jgi:Tol biopolymer transport system component
MLTLITSCWSAPPFRNELLVALERDHLSLLEFGTFGEVRTLGLSDLFFKTQKLADASSVIMGASSAGDRLLMNVASHRTSYTPEIPDEVDITRIDGAIITKIRLPIRGMISFCAELSPDGQSIAFGGQFARIDARGVYGLHLVAVSGAIRTLLATTEAQTPLSIGWSKDGRMIVYDQDGRVLLYHLDTDSVTSLTEGSRPTWSPDGQWIAYRRPDGRAGLIRPDGRDSKPVLDGVQLGWGLRWTPDSRYLMYSDAIAGGIRVADTETGTTATMFRPMDSHYTEARLRWVRRMFP